MWNIEYRRVGNGGGWPPRSSTSPPRSTICRSSTPRSISIASACSGTPPVAISPCGRRGGGGCRRGARVPRRGALRAAARGDRPGRACATSPTRYRGSRVAPAEMLMGGAPEELPERYQAADPIGLLPTGVPVLLVHGVVDETVSVRYSRSYAGRPRERRGGRARRDRGRGRASPSPHRSARRGLGGGRRAPGTQRGRCRWRVAPAERSLSCGTSPARPAGARRSRRRPCRRRRRPRSQAEPAMSRCAQGASPTKFDRNAPPTIVPALRASGALSRSAYLPLISSSYSACSGSRQTISPLLLAGAR